MLDVTVQTLLTFTDSSFPSDAHNQIELLRRCACLCVLCECVCLQIWQDDLIHQGLPLPTLGGNKNNLAKRAVHFHMHSRTHPRLRLRGQAIGLEQPNHVTLHTRKHIKPHTPIYLNLATCLCIGTNAVKPPLGCGMNSKAICLVSTHPLSLSLSLSFHLPVFFLSLLNTCSFFFPS